MAIARSSLFVASWGCAAAAALLAVPPAWSLGFGEVRVQAVLGQSLNLALPISLADGESLGADCASAEVTAGESRLAPGTVRVRVTQGRDASEAIIRVATTVPIEEPVLQLVVNVGCPPRVTRTVTVLADPPMVSAVVAESPRATSQEPSAASTAATPATSGAAEPPRRATRPAAPQRATRASVRPPPVARAVAPAAAVAPSSSRSASAAVARAPSRVEPARSRLQLEAPRVATTPGAAASAAPAEGELQAVAAAQAAASTAQGRMSDMEAELARVRADAKAQTDALLQLRAQIAQDREQRERQNNWTPFLLAALAVFAMVAVWLGWRLRQQQLQEQRRVWWERSRQSEVASRAHEEESNFGVSQAPRPAVAPSRPGALAAPIVTEHGAFDSMMAPPTVPAPVAVTIPPIKSVEDESTRAMTVDEQIDLEQQADFFIALGHDEAAIDLLMAHLRSTGGGTPLPFLKLLEIHRRRGDREAYERTRVRFNQRFNSIAPDWNSDPKSGRSLEDYPLTIGRLQTAWPRPLDAMAELEAFLFRRGGEAEMFDLPAYQEVLFLYQMARDLHNADEPGAAAGAVDVLLPIGGEVAAPTAEGTISLKPEFNHGKPLSLDLDLTGSTAAPKGAAPDMPSLSLDILGDTLPPEIPEDVWGTDPQDNKRRT